MDTKHQHLLPMEQLGDTGVVYIGQSGGFQIGQCANPGDVAAFIVRACNSHEQLVAALKKTQALLFMRTNSKDEEAMAALQQSRAALAEAGAV